ncbi:branched-chain amino acid ABC transporter permease [Streptomyces millisiae]|uniref:Branched-chain amino acid ABC transporter permease n=1 Tax=Streptomyces millisiae TaxID=3075542 RepID=A0ABU2LPW3_9ACTN|nr:branched-chain amino acid ABC transporter permease [Streptomyces sp. DSM 44918]MDT0319078.1 branched-chain amino acid ABC transporter permease [Streptomyces sp. DSM 44918]
MSADVSVRKPLSAAARLRQRRWYQQPRWQRLFGMVVLAVVMAQVTGEQGERNDLFHAIQANFQSTGVLVWLAILVGVWAVREFYGEQVGTQGRRWGGEITRPIQRLVGQVRGQRAYRWGGLGALLVFLIILPLLVSTFWQQVLVDQIGVYVMVAIGLNVVIGWAGMLDLGFIAFFAIGAYSAAFWTGGLPVEPPFELNNFLVIPIAVLTCLIAGVLLGAPTLRLRGDYLAIVTLGFHEIVYLLARNLNEFTGGTRGAQGLDKFSVDLGFWSYDWELDPQPYYWVQLAAIVIVLVLFIRLEHSRVGRAWTAIREDEVAAAATGVDTVRFKLLAFAIGASTSGVAGVIYASKQGFINPEQFVVMMSVLALAYVVFGGMGSIPGVLLGTAILVWLPEYLRDTVDPQDRFLYLGGLLVLMMIYRPQGLWPSRRRQHELKMAEEGTAGADALGAQPGGAQS